MCVRQNLQLTKCRKTNQLVKLNIRQKRQIQLALIMYTHLLGNMSHMTENGPVSFLDFTCFMRAANTD